MAVLIYIDGVLANKQNVAIKDGLGLTRTLQKTVAVILLAKDKDKAEHWLKQNSMGKIDNLVGVVPGGDSDPFRQAEWCRSQGPIDYVITSDPALAAKLLEHGFRVLLYLDPIYIDHKFRPDSIEGRKSWGDITAELDKQADMYLDDPRKWRLFTLGQRSQATVSFWGQRALNQLELVTGV